MDPSLENLPLPERVWNSLKSWAQIRSETGGFPSADDCAAQVRRVVSTHTGRPGGLPDAVVQFYAAETLQMVEKYRTNRDADDSVAGTGLQPAI